MFNSEEIFRDLKGGKVMSRIQVVMTEEEVSRLEEKKIQYEERVGIKVSRQNFARIYLIKALNEGWLPT